MQFITEWIHNIIVFILLATVITMLLPNSSMQKYVKFVVSLLLIVLILNPLFKLLHTDINEVISSFNDKAYVANGNVENLIDVKKKEIQASQRAYILKQMAVQMEKQVAEDLQKKYGVTMADVRLTVKEGRQEVQSVEDLAGVTVTVVKGESKRSTTIETVKKVEINTDTPYQSRLEDNTSSDIQNYLAREWQLEEKKISVVVEGGTGRTNE
ncbi:stage III sporulation protein AF [Bacillus sp. 165]|uniref:stage III sporulation protein AF n=1 Tax=Bacillus sp. 165 TaxID=1529117 RepID=UPI001ADA9690|nr:stage III sporulation protein AF [Bacillus sp. 165]MBO9129704.1 stage III sporulation protein AF [Bacillus sp. 165]